MQIQTQSILKQIKQGERINNMKKKKEAQLNVSYTGRKIECSMPVVIKLCTRICKMVFILYSYSGRDSTTLYAIFTGFLKFWFCKKMSKDVITVKTSYFIIFLSFSLLFSFLFFLFEKKIIFPDFPQ